ncbi:hypothetical protein [Clostridioides difficile]|uniref:hypothetical protein n=1 Tax=Clostridioides difficile TaxID=1496 RepID=UPI0018AA5885|nr:hypothetical protein [Clostridioides difficile]MBF8988694.1 hypothetical protein [Clostridioides difficile]
MAAVSTVNATNGTLTIVLDKTPTVDPVEGDFTAKKSIEFYTRAVTNFSSCSLCYRSRLQEI